MNTFIYIPLITILSFSTPEIVPKSEVVQEKLPPKITLEPLKLNPLFHRPVDLISIPKQINNLLLAQQSGEIIEIDLLGKNAPRTILDLTEIVFTKHNEEGLLSIALDPKFEKTGKLFVWYSANNPRRGVLSHFKIKKNKDGLLVGDINSEKIILEIDQPFGNHNGGTILFGADQMLYLSIGDGGAANDPFNHSQNLNTLLGTIIRIDVSKTTDKKPYAIPKDNPFINRESCRPEIWAYGLRNVWRMSFDIKGRLWAGDVGQNKWEEVNLITRGGNYGWDIKEGNHDFRKRKESNSALLINPILEYPRKDGASITGGIVYTGQKIPKLKNYYLFSDYYSGKIWATPSENPGKKYSILKRPGLMVASFGKDLSNEIWICTFNENYPQKGRVSKLIKAP